MSTIGLMKTTIWSVTRLCTSTTFGTKLSTFFNARVASQATLTFTIKCASPDRIAIDVYAYIKIIPDVMTVS